MPKNAVFVATKQHPLAVIIYVFYSIAWLAFCFLTYYFLVQGDADILQAILFYWVMGACIPYLVVNIILSYQAKKNRRFYKRMANLVFMPIGLVLLVFAVHAVVAYFNKGI